MRLPAHAAPRGDPQTRAEVDATRLRAHQASARAAGVASAVVAALALALTQGLVERGRLLAWLAALLLAIAWRAGQPRLQWPAGAAQDDPAAAAAVGHRLRRYRVAILLHGVVWGVMAWLPASLADPQPQAALVTLLAGLTVGAMAMMLFDPLAALGFGLAVQGPLLARLVLLDGPWSQATAVALAMGLLLLGMLALAGRRAERARRTLAVTRQAERLSAQGAREAQALLNQVFAHAGQGISVFDADLRLLAWNDGLLACTHLPPTLVRQGVAWRDCLRHLAEQGEFGAVDTVAEVERRLQSLRGAAAGVSQARRRDGRLIETRHNPLPGGGLLMFHVDITDREASRLAAAEQQRMLSLVLERTEQGFWFIDNALRTTDANPAMCRMLGLGRAQMLGRSIYEFVDDENRAIFEHHVALRASGQAEGYEIALRRADGSLVHCFNNATPVFDDAGRKVGALGLFSDISAQKQAALQIHETSAALALKSRVLELTLDSLAQGVLNVDPQGRCIAWNRRFLDLLQLPESLMQTRPTLGDLRQWQRAQGAFGDRLERFNDVGRDIHVRALAGAPDEHGQRYQRSRADGTVIEVVSYVATDGSLVRTYTDITAATRAEAALIAARDEAEAANRAKSEFLSRMSHELRTPLNAILGFGQLLQADPADPPSPGQRPRLDELMRGGRHLLALINDVLDVARIEAGNLQLSLAPVDLGELALEAMRLVQPMAEARGVALVGPAPDPVAPAVVQADATRLRQVLLNLLSNAIKFNREAGQVRVTVQRQGAGVQLEVADQGPGIGPEQLPRLFQAFERLDMAGAIEGTGIGLALSRSLVALMHGQVGVRSTPGEGSVFWVRLPRGTGLPVAPPEALPGPPATARADPAQRRYDVLYIEDNEVNQVLMQGMLAHRPAIALRLAALPEEGLALAAAQPPDLVLLDIQLPGIDGFEVLRRLRRLPGLAQVPVIAVSANAMPDDLAEARRAGFADYLTKPVNMPRLLALLDAALAAPVAGGGAPAAGAGAASEAVGSLQAGV